MNDKTITFTESEFAMITSAMAFYMLKEFPMGKSSYSHPIGTRDRREWRKFGKAVWDKLVKEGGIR